MKSPLVAWGLSMWTPYVIDGDTSAAPAFEWMTMTRRNYITRAASVSIAYEGKADGDIPPPIAMLLELLVAHAIEPDAALKLIEVNVAKAQRQAKAERVNKAPRFFQTA